MSASLVGSEMCIRDSNVTARTPIGKPISRKRHPSHASLLRGSRLSRSTVSYTHLTLPTICSV
eukprot:5236007-Alexandrium_andersonii.AAC.1